MALVTLPAERRRIFWIKSVPNSGKGIMVEFLNTATAWITPVFQNVDLEFPGCLEITSCLSSLRDFAMLYQDAHVNHKPPGLVVVDAPKEMKFGKKACSTLERAADAGQCLTFAKYRGGKPVLNSHVVIFANVDPPRSLEERCVWLLDVQGLDHQTQWQYPFLPPNHAHTAHALAMASAAVPLPEDVPVPLPGAGPPALAAAAPPGVVVAPAAGAALAAAAAVLVAAGGPALGAAAPVLAAAPAVGAGAPAPGRTQTGKPVEKEALNQLRKHPSKSNIMEFKVLVNDEDYPLWHVVMMENLQPYEL